jgi:hypothetical protein
MKRIEFDEIKKIGCPTCEQTTVYELSIDRGTVKILKQMSRFIKKKGINAVHPRDEMEGIWLTSNEVGNLSRARKNGLIAKIEGNAGNYCITKRGFDFLNGIAFPKTAVVSKIEKKTIGFIEEDGTVTVNSFNTEDDYWEGAGYEIKEGTVITKI